MPKSQQKNGRTYAPYRRDEEQAARLRREWSALPAELRARAVPLHWVHSAERGGWTEKNGKFHPWADDRKAASAQKWSSLPPMAPEMFDALLARVGEDWGPAVDGWALTRDGLKLGPVGGVGVRLGSHAEGSAKNSEGRGPPWADGCLVAVDCDSEAKAADALEVLGAVLGCTGGAVARRVRKGSNRWAVLLRVEGLERPPKSEALHFEGGEMVELLGQGAYLAACYLHPSGQWVEWVEGEKTLPAPVVHDVTLEQFKAFKAALEKLPGAKGWPSETKAKTGAQAAQELGGVDRVAEWLKKHAPEWLPDVKSFVRGETPEGALDIFCPFGGHDDGTPSSTRYLPQGVSDGEREGPGFNCFHASCPGRGVGVGGLRARLRELDPKFTLLSPEEVALFEVAGMSAPVALPKDFCTRDGWIWRSEVRGKDEKLKRQAMKLLRMPFAVYGDAFEELGGGQAAHCYTVEGVDGAGVTRRLFIPRGTQAPRLHEALLNAGFGVARGNGVAEAVAAFIHAMSALSSPVRATSRTGWAVGPEWRAGDELPKGAALILPGGEAIHPQNDAESLYCIPNGQRLPKVGTVEGWRDNVGALLRGQSKALLALSMAFFAPVARPLAWPGVFLFLTGASSGGKTTILEAVASVDGDKVYGARATANALQLLFAMHPDRLRTMDELTARKSSELRGLGYLANGDGRDRMTQGQADGKWGVDEAPPFTPVCLGTAEQSLETLLEAGDFTAGQEARFLCVESDAKAGFGCFSHVDGVTPGPDETPGGALSNKIKKAAASYKGAVGRAWRRWLVDNVARWRAELPKVAEAFEREALAFVCDQEGPPNAVGARIIQTLARLFACLDLANSSLRLELGELGEAFKIEALGHLRARELFGAAVETRVGIQLLDEFLSENGACFRTHPGEKLPRDFGFFLAYCKATRSPLYGFRPAQFAGLCKRERWGEPSIFIDALRETGRLFKSADLPRQRFFKTDERGERVKLPSGLFFLRGRPGGGLAEGGVDYERADCLALASREAGFDDGDEADKSADEWPNMSASAQAKPLN